MALGVAQVQQRFENPREIFGDRLRERSIYWLLADHGGRLISDDYFADLYTKSVRGRPTVPARVLATVMVLQAFEGSTNLTRQWCLPVLARWRVVAGICRGRGAWLRSQCPLGRHPGGAALAPAQHRPRAPTTGGPSKSCRHAM